MKRFIVLLPLLLLALSCTKIDYIGQEFPPTTQVDMYFSQADVAKDYTVMGSVIATATDIVRYGEDAEGYCQESQGKGRRRHNF